VTGKKGFNLVTVYGSRFTLFSFYPFERPLPVDEFQMEARDAVDARARGADGGDDGEPRLRAGQTHQTPALDLKRRPDGRAAAADVLRHRLLAGRHTPLRVEDLQPHVQSHLEPRLLGTLGGRRLLDLLQLPQ